MRDANERTYVAFSRIGNASSICLGKDIFRSLFIVIILSPYNESGQFKDVSRSHDSEAGEVIAQTEIVAVRDSELVVNDDPTAFAVG